MKQLVRLNKRPSRDGRTFTYFLRYDGENGKRKWETLGHGDLRKAERQRAQKEKELRMGYVAPGSMRLGEFVKDSFMRTGDHQVSPRLLEKCCKRNLRSVTHESKSGANWCNG